MTQRASLLRGAAPYPRGSARGRSRCPEPRTCPSLSPAERLIKQTITDNSPSVASAGLVSAIFLLKDNSDVVKRWANEVNNQVRGVASRRWSRRAAPRGR